MHETWSECQKLQGNQIILVSFFDLTPLTPSKWPKTSKNATRAVCVFLFFPSNLYIYVLRAIKLEHGADID